MVVPKATADSGVSASPGSDKAVETTAKSTEPHDHVENATTGDVSSYIQEKTEVCADINHVASLGFDNVPELERKIVRRLDTWMLPQLWILYMFNYLNRTNIAQARLNTFNQDLNLQDGDYQVSTITGGQLMRPLLNV
jgi:hypothetical protein